VERRRVRREEPRAARVIRSDRTALRPSHPATTLAEIHTYPSIYTRERQILARLGTGLH
jgi:hypothetical protein